MTMKRGTNLLNILMIYFNYLSNNKLPNASHNLYIRVLSSDLFIALSGFSLFPMRRVRHSHACSPRNDARRRNDRARGHDDCIVHWD